MTLPIAAQNAVNDEVLAFVASIRDFYVAIRNANRDNQYPSWPWTHTFTPDVESPSPADNLTKAALYNEIIEEDWVDPEDGLTKKRLVRIAGRTLDDVSAAAPTRCRVRVVGYTGNKGKLRDRTGCYVEAETDYRGTVYRATRGYGWLAAEHTDVSWSDIVEPLP